MIRVPAFRPRSVVRVGVVYGVPVGLWLGMQVAPASGHLWVFAAVGAQMAYLVARPSVERSVWVLLSYVFSVGGSALSSSLFPAFAGVPPWLTWLSYVIIPAAALGHLVARRPWRPRPVVMAVAGLTAWAAVGGVIHDVSVVDLFGWVAHFLRFPLWFLVLASAGLAETTLRRFLNAYLALAALQLPLVVIGFYLEGGSFASVNPDVVVGSMYGALTTGMGLTLAAAFAVVFARALSVGPTPARLLTALALLLPIVVVRAGFSMVVSAMLALFVIVRGGVLVRGGASPPRLVLRPWVMPAFGLGGLLVLLIGWLAVTYTPRSEVARVINGVVTDSRLGAQYFSGFTDPHRSLYRSRQMFIATVVQWYVQHPEQLLFGTVGPRYGLGNQRRLTSGDLAGPLAPLNREVGLDPLMPHDLVQLPRTVLEVGVVGLGLYYWLICTVWLTARRRARALGDRSWQGHLLGFEAIWLLYGVFGVLYEDVWRLDHLALGFWLWAAALVSVTPASNRAPNGVGR